MKFVKKLTALFLAVCMVMAMGITAFADEVKYTITVPADDSHTYEVYQIFTGDYSADKGTLSNVKWGQNGTGETGESATTEAEALAEVSGSDTEKLAEIAKYVDLTSSAYDTVTNAEGLEVPAGYYLLKDRDGSLAGEDDAYSTYVVKVVKNVTVARKADKPSVVKKVQDTNDSKANSTTGWQDSADYDVNDAVPFQLTATLPSNADDFAAYKSYKLVFHDTQSAGLTFNSNSVVVKYGDKTLATDQYTVDTNPTDKHTFDITIANVKSIKDTDGSDIAVAASGKFTVEYTSTLNENAKIGSEGNPNEVYLEYSNNPNAGGEGETGKTPTDKVIVFTYKVVVNKVDAENKPLDGAGFTLYKKNTSGEYVAVGKEIRVKAVTGDDGQVESYTSEFLRVDDGDYKLVETTVPDGYNKIADVEFTITATHREEADDPTLITLEGGNKFTGDVNTGALTGDIENKKGAELPETGGMGTTVLYVAGIAMIVAAGVVVIARKRMA